MPGEPPDCGEITTGPFTHTLYVSQAGSHTTTRVQTGNIGDSNLAGKTSTACDSNGSGHARRQCIYNQTPLAGLSLPGALCSFTAYSNDCVVLYSK